MRTINLSFICKSSCLFPFLILLAACGDGGGGSSSSSSSTPAASTSQTYTASATAGEVLSYTMDTTKLTYSYVVTKKVPMNAKLKHLLVILAPVLW